MSAHVKSWVRFFAVVAGGALCGFALPTGETAVAWIVLALLSAHMLAIGGSAIVLRWCARLARLNATYAKRPPSPRVVDAAAMLVMEVTEDLAATAGTTLAGCAALALSPPAVSVPVVSGCIAGLLLIARASALGARAIALYEQSVGASAEVRP